MLGLKSCEMALALAKGTKVCVTAPADFGHGRRVAVSRQVRRSFQAVLLLAEASSSTRSGRLEWGVRAMISDTPFSGGAVRQVRCTSGRGRYCNLSRRAGPANPI
jgi:hypothetical protein